MLLLHSRTPRAISTLFTSHSILSTKPTAYIVKWNIDSNTNNEVKMLLTHISVPAVGWMSERLTAETNCCYPSGTHKQTLNYLPKTIQYICTYYDLWVYYIHTVAKRWLQGLMLRIHKASMTMSSDTLGSVLYQWNFSYISHSRSNMAYKLNKIKISKTEVWWDASQKLLSTIDLEGKCLCMYVWFAY